MPSSDRFLLAVDGISQELRVVRFKGSEGISELFHFEVLFACEDGSLAYDDFLGKAALLTLVSPTEGDRFVHGIVSRFEQLDPGKKLTAYRITLVPRVSRMRHRRDNRIFQDLTLPEIIGQVLQAAGLESDKDYRLSLQGTYPKFEYRVQYGETDWDFVCRLMEEAGIFHQFEHGDGGHVLVLGDKTEVHPPIAGDSTVRYMPLLGALAAGPEESISRFAYAEEIRAGKTTLRDYDFKKPALLLESRSTGTTNTDLELYDNPGNYSLPGVGDAIAVMRLEAETGLRKIGEGESSRGGLIAGSTFTMSEHPREAFNESWLITRMTHRGTEPAMDENQGEAVYSNTFEVIPATVPYRPRRVTPRPSIRGVQTAFVVGPASEEIYTDEHGRVKVQFHWDRLGNNDDKSSCWIRVSQIWAGDAFGSMHIPRVGHEVVVAFEEGNPDRPLIVGRVYHGTNVPPYALPAEKTKSTIKSRSTPNGTGSNELRFEDKKGSEEVYLHAEKDHNVKVVNDHNEKVLHDQTLSVSHDRTKQIDHDQALTVGNDDTITVQHDRKEDISNNETVTVGNDRSTTIKHDHTQSVGNDETLTVTGDRKLSIDGGQTTKITKDDASTISGSQTITVTKAVSHTFDDALSLTLSKDRTEKIGGGATLSIAKDQAIKIGGKHQLEITGDSEEKVAGKKKLTFDQELVIEVGAAKITLKADGTITLEGVKLEIKGSAAVNIQGAQLALKGDATAKIEAGAKMDLKAAMLDMNGSGIVKMGGGVVGIG